MKKKTESSYTKTQVQNQIVEDPAKTSRIQTLKRNGKHTIRIIAVDRVGVHAYDFWKEIGVHDTHVTTCELGEELFRVPYMYACGCGFRFD